MLIRGIDTLEFGLDINDYIVVFSPILEILKEYKQIAQEENRAVEFDIFGLILLVEKSGMPFYAYRLTCKDFILGFADKSSTTNPDIRVKFLSGFLWSYGAKEAVNIFMDWFSNFHIAISNNRLSRVDICADSDEVIFVTGDLKSVATRAKQKATHYVSDVYHNGKAFSGFTIGRGQPILARIYDKTKEIKSSGKLYFADLWETQKWDHSKPVWRVEFQLRREILKELDIEKLEDLWVKEDGLWSYLTKKWLLLKATNDTNVSRRETKRKWLIIQNAQNCKDILPLVRSSVIQGDMKRLLDQMSGLVVTIAAGGNCDCLDQALRIVKGYAEIKYNDQENSFNKRVNCRRSQFIKNKTSDLV